MPTITFKVTAAEARILRAKARALKASSMSAYIRKATLGDEKPSPKIVRKLHPVSGLPYNAAPGRVVSDDEIRDALADFP